MSMPVEFELDETPTFPTRSASGNRINFRIVRAMSAQHESAKEASEALDDWIRMLRRFVGDSMPPLGGPT